MKPESKMKMFAWTVAILMLGAVFVSVVAFYYS
jgi:hypothetical protein